MPGTIASVAIGLPNRHQYASWDSQDRAAVGVLRAKLECSKACGRCYKSFWTHQVFFGIHCVAPQHSRPLCPSMANFQEVGGGVRQPILDDGCIAIRGATLRSIILQLVWVRHILSLHDCLF